MSTAPILFIEPNGAPRDALFRLLQRQQFRILSSEVGEMTKLVGKYKPAVSIIGPTTSAHYNVEEVVLSIRRESEGTPVILITDDSSEALAIEALRAGINGYLKYPCGSLELAFELKRCFVKSDQIATTSACEPVEMIGVSESIQALKVYLSRVALTDSNVLITGETGTGKELAAEFVHRRSSRKHRPLVTVNCAAIPDSLLESELFGHERGAFTGAHSASDGKLKAANGGTIFLDEIGDMSPYAQAKILRAIDNKEIQRLGNPVMMPLNVRIIAATNQPLETLVSEGKFRKDLFFRLNVARAHIPPLRERKEDIPGIVTHYLRSMSARFGGKLRTISEDAWLSILSYAWPGNIRELKNMVEVLCIDASATTLSARDLPQCVFEADSERGTRFGDERKRLLSALSATDWNKSRAAEKLRWSRMTLYRKMAKYQVSKTLAAQEV